MTIKILANDGIDASGKKALEALGCIVDTEKIAQDQLAEAIRNQGYVGLLVRSATTARQDLIDACPNLKFIGRGGVGIDNIDAEYARSKGIEVFNTPASSSQAVAELVMSLMFASARGIYDAGTQMPVNGAQQFESLKKKYAKGIELRGKTLGIIGFGRIGQSLAGYALGCGMKVIAHDRLDVKSIPVEVHIGEQIITLDVHCISFEEVIRQSDFISLHVPKQANGAAVIGTTEINMLKRDCILINTSRGGVIDEQALMQALQNGQIRYGCLDVFVGEPKPNQALLQHPGVISTPHIGASTMEAQERIGLEIADNVKRIYKL